MSARTVSNEWVLRIFMPPTVGKGAISVAFVRLYPSVAYTANNSRTQSSSMPKFGRRVTHLRCDSHTSFKIKRSKVRVGGSQGIPCRPNPVAILLVYLIFRSVLQLDTTTPAGGHSLLGSVSSVTPTSDITADILRGLIQKLSITHDYRLSYATQCTSLLVHVMLRKNGNYITIGSGHFRSHESAPECPTQT